jgi:hypothetical protein
MKLTEIKNRIYDQDLLSLLPSAAREKAATQAAS